MGPMVQDLHGEVYQDHYVPRLQIWNLDGEVDAWLASAGGGACRDHSGDDLPGSSLRLPFSLR